MSRALHGYGAELLARLGLHPGQELILMQLYDRDGQTQKQLMTAVGLDHSTVSRTVHRMQDAGLVTLAPSTADRRAREVRLTPAGKELRRPLSKVWQTLDLLAVDVLAAAPSSSRDVFLGVIADLEAVYGAARAAGRGRRDEF